MDVISDRDVANRSLEAGLSMSDQSHEQQKAWVIPGLPTAVGVVAALGLGIALAATAGKNGGVIALGIVVIVVAGFGFGGFFVVQPNESRVLILFGRYIGSVTEAGWWWCNPFAKKQKLSLRVRNFQSERIKVNDLSGNPIEIAAVVVWRVTDTAKAVFDVADYEQFVTVQSETSLRHVASEYPYDDYKPDTTSLRGNADEVRGTLQVELQSRLRLAGIEILETRLRHLACGPGVSEAVLRRQQAEAILAARRTMVMGAVGLVQMALAQLADSDLVELDTERKATMVSNLMVGSSDDHPPTAVITSGSLYS